MVKGFEFRQVQVTFLIALIALLSSCSTALERSLADLDATMENREVYLQEFNVKMDSIRMMYSEAEEESVKWDLANVMFKEYVHFSLDSAYVCLSMMKQHCLSPEDFARTSMAEVNLLNLKQMHDLAVLKFNSIDTTLAYSDALRNEYLICAMYLYKNIDAEQMNRYRLEYLDIDTVSVFGQKIHAQYLRDMGEYQRALDILLSCDGTEDNWHDRTSTVYNIAMIYDALGNKDKKKEYLVRSGICDFHVQNRDYMSIYQLALELYEEGELELAKKYIETNLMDVIEGGFDHRIINSSKAHHIITEATAEAEKNRARFVMFVLLVMSMLLLLICSILYYLRKQNKRLKEARLLLTSANAQVKRQNMNLVEANLIKDNYVFRYMDLSIKYLEKLERYRHDIRQELKVKSVDAVMKELRNPSEIYAEYKKFYQIFDETFLNIFPDFREKVNELLREECRIPVPQEKVLSTEQRILAVIRLGINESGKIASFLNCAPPTIYTYRTKLRNAAICSKDEFEDRVRHL